MDRHGSFAKIWKEKVVIPTYEVGKPDRNPMFLEKRVYQGSCGKVYPYPVIDKIYDEKIDKEYEAIFLENEYIKVMILPELGGRIQRAYDKTNGYDFVYYNEVIKPALVGLLGPWISGGIEFNWPQHHRPTTYMQTDFRMLENGDGSVSLETGDLDEMYGTKVLTRFTIHPGKAYIEINAQLYNRTDMAQTFLWWANPAVAVNDDTQSVFPPDVNAVFDHGKRAVSKFPIATGVYYKHDYSEGVDISRYKNIPVPTSYMAHKSNFNFVGGYDYGRKAGLLHVADHHVSPGKKQWTWGCGDFGQAWDRNLTDANGPYIELMTGVYTDNQPDFSWLMPFEEKTFTQYFMPYKNAGYVKNASTEMVINFECVNDECVMYAYPTSYMKEIKIKLTHENEIIYEKNTTITVEEGFSDSVKTKYREDELVFSVHDAKGRLIISSAPKKKTIEEIPEPAEAAKAPEEIMTNEELLLTGQQIEQYRHATFDPDPYYLEGLKRDAYDSRLNTAYGLLLLRRSRLEEAEKHFRMALKRITWRTPNPYNSEPLYYLGLTLLYQGKKDEAFDMFYKTTWTEDGCEKGWYQLASIASSKKDYSQAMYFVDRALVYNAHNIKAKALKVFLLSASGKKKKAIEAAEKNLEYDPFDWASWTFLMEEKKVDGDDLKKKMHCRKASFIYTAADLIAWGFYGEALKLLAIMPDSPMKYYYSAYAASLIGDETMENKMLEKAQQADSIYCFPNTLDDQTVLKYAIRKNDKDAKAPYYLGCLYYDKKRYEDAFLCWMKSFNLDSNFPTLLRNLAIVLCNKMGRKQEALSYLERAFKLDKTDARVFLELDQLKEKLGVDAIKRKKAFDDNISLIEVRDDLYCTYVYLLNILGEHEKALSMIMAHKFHPWEGGEGKVSHEYILANKMIAIAEMEKGNLDAAEKHLEDALVYPYNLGEGKLEGSKDNDIRYLLGLVAEKKGNKEKAMENFQKALWGAEELTGAMYYYDQPADMIMYQGLALNKLGDTKAAAMKFNKLIDYGEKHMFDDVKIDFFAVSLPDLQLWDDDLNRKNRAHCYFVIGLGNLGLGKVKEAEEAFSKALEINGYHISAKDHKALIPFLLEK